MSAIEEIQKKLSTELEKYKALTNESSKHFTMKQKLDAQLSENTIVDEEFALLTQDSVVYKLTGPVLIQQDLEEAKQNVAKRIEFIKNEVKRVDATLADIDEKGEKQKETISKLQNQLKQHQLRAMNVPFK